MLWKTCRRGMVSGLGVAGCLLVLAAGAMAAKGRSPSMPKFSKVKKTVLQYFEKLPGYRPGDILSQGQVKPVFRDLDRIGWPLAKRKEILEAVLPEGDPLVRQLRTPAGKRFARQVAKVPQGYDRLDRLSHLPRGRQNVQNLIRGPDGYLMIKYMTTTPQGKNLGKMLSKDPGGKGFNKSTGRIYTVDMLLDRLEQEYAKATGKKVKPKPSSGKSASVRRRVAGP